MKKYLLLFYFLVTVGAIVPGNAQSFCNSKEEKIKYEGVAPMDIDGNVSDWELILGAPTGNSLMPYMPESGFNWSIDGFVENAFTDYDHPEPKNDIRFFAFTNDDYNVYFYLRRQVVSNDENTLFYFIDVNADGFMNSGEPVLKVKFNSRRVSSLSMGLYLPDKSTDYDSKKGSYMINPAPEPQDQQYLADGYALRGRVIELFTASRLLRYFQLNENEVFSAAVTEDGYGLEFAVPWRLLRNWLWFSRPLHPNNIFTYHISFQSGSGVYSPVKVVDNAGGCCGGLAVSGNSDAVVTDQSFSNLDSDTSYRFTFTLQNNTNVEERIGLSSIILEDITTVGNKPADSPRLAITAFRDDNCNRTVDDTAQARYEFFGTGLSGGQLIYSTSKSLSQNVAPGATVCYIVDVRMPKGVFESFTININPLLSFNLVIKDCLGPSVIEGGKPINPVAFRIGSFITGLQKAKSRSSQSFSEEIRVYPNPSRGFINIKVPNGTAADLFLTDYTGRMIKRWYRTRSQTISVQDLKAGVYILRSIDADTGKQTIQKIVIQN